MAEGQEQKPIILLARPLLWLDEREEESRQWLMSRFALTITAFENTIDVVSFAIEEYRATGSGVTT